MGVFQYPAPKPGDPEGGLSRLSNGAAAEAAGHGLEREAAARLLASGEFHRSPNLEKILRYLCEQYFRGKSLQIKEYSIATEALGRKEDFDPKRDAIVRVEMHRLRKRLKEYYESRGAEETIRIHLPEKSYVPEFERVDSGQALALLGRAQAGAISLAGAAGEVAEGRPQQSGGWRGRKAWFAWGLGMVILVGTGYLIISRAPEGRVATAVPAAHTGSEASGEVVLAAGSGINTGGEIRILAGRPKGRYPDRYGTIWQGDEFFRGGSSVPVQTDVHSRGLDSNLFSNMREGEFEYDIPLLPGSYELHLFFAETSMGEGTAFGGGEGSGTFHVHVNGKVVLENFDVLADAHDSNSATSRVFKDVGPAKDGKLHLRFEPGASRKAFVNAIVIRPGIAGRMKPLRIVCRPSVYRDSKNAIWEPDHYYRGGVQITRPTGAPVPKDPDIFKGERYGKFSYTIPVPPGKYQARLYFWEYWFGPDAPGKGGPGSRLFDVFCNFRPLLSNFDVIKRSPQSHYVMETFHGLEPNLDSKLVFEFAPKANYALLNALEIADDDFVFERR